MYATKTAYMMTREETVLPTSFLVRVMLSHVRQAYDNCANHDVHPLDRVFAIINAPSSVGVSRLCRVTRLEQRIGSRPNPFIHFRTGAEAGDEEEDDEAIVFVSAYWKPNQRGA